jgi:hypothetical protein
MNFTLYQAINVAIVFLGPLVAVTTVALVRWVVDRDLVALGGRLRRWGIRATIASYGVFAAVMTMSMIVNSEDYALATALGAAALFAGLPLGAWAWQRVGARGLPVAVWAGIAGLCALALAVTVNPQPWAEVQEGGFPIASVLALAIGAAAAVWGRRAPLPAGSALLVAGIVPLGTILVAPAAADVVLIEMFAPMPMFAVLGAVLLAAAWVDARAARREVDAVTSNQDPHRTMAA